MRQAAIAEPVTEPAVMLPRKTANRSTGPIRLAIETPRLILRAHEGDDPTVLGVTILLKPGLAEAGWMRFSLREERDREVELEFFLESSCRGRGLMREAACAAVPQVLRLLNARVLGAALPADSGAAEGVVRALGLVASSRRGATRRFEKDLCGLI